jgi:hypothetical protein
VARGRIAYDLADLTATPNEDEQAGAGLQLLNTILSKQPLRIRDHVDQDFYHRGKHHMLAQDATLGWHPEFQERVAALLLGQEATA